MVIRRGSVGWYHFGPVTGSVPAGRRPVVVVQSDALSRSNWNTTIVAPLKSNLTRAAVPGHVLIPAAVSGLAQDSLLVAAQVRVVNVDDVEQASGPLPSYLLDDIDTALRVVLGL